MSQLERLASVERQLAELRRDIRGTSRGPHPFVGTRIAKVVTAATTGETFSIVFLDGEYYKTHNSAAASYADRQNAAAETCQNIYASGGKPPVNTRLEVFWWGDRWWTWYSPAGTSTTADKSFWLVGPPEWTVADPTVQQTALVDQVVTTPTSAYGNPALGAKAGTSTLYSAASTVATYDDAEDDFALKGPVTLLEDGRFEVNISGDYSLIRSTGAAADPGPSDGLLVFTKLQEADGSTVTHDLQIGWNTHVLIGDTSYDWQAWETGYEQAKTSGYAPHHVNHRNVVRLYAGRFYLPYAAVEGTDEYGAIFFNYALTLRKLSD